MRRTRKDLTLIGRGAVGSSFIDFFNSTNIEFALYHKTNIEEAFGTKPKLLIYAGVPGVKWRANLDPEKDFDEIQKSIGIIKNIDPENLIFISTIDTMFRKNDKEHSAYGENRKRLESLILNNFKNAKILRLPALSGKTIKKNFFYDLQHPLKKNSSEINDETLAKLNEIVKEYSEKRNLKEQVFVEKDEIYNDKLNYYPSREYWIDNGLGMQLLTDPESIFVNLNLDELPEYIFTNFIKFDLSVIETVPNRNLIISGVSPIIKAKDKYFSVYGESMLKTKLTSPVDYDKILYRTEQIYDLHSDDIVVKKI